METTTEVKHLSESTDAAMSAAGVDVAVSQEVDYFDFEEIGEFTLPDGRQKIFLKALNEGAKRKFQKDTSRDLRVQRSSGDALVKMDPGQERYTLCMESITGWTLRRRNPKNRDVWEDAPSDKSNIARFLEKTNPAIVEDLEKEIRKLNPWLLDELSVKEIDKEIENLNELRTKAVEREAAKADSAS
jgi:hypothetical protein